MWHLITMERILIEQNPWWANANAIEQDKHIQEYRNTQVKFPLPALRVQSGV
ncbi:MAG: hypothetical protein ACP5JC_00070 [Candidatus Micrarchaeia archaeon]